MEEIEEQELYALLKQEKKIENKTIKISQIELENLNSIEFLNCSFVSHLLIFCDSDKIKNPDLINKKLTLNNCSFRNCNIISGNFTILNLNNIKVIDTLTISNSTINLFNFDECLNIDYKITIGKCSFNEVFTIINNEFKEKGELKLSNIDIHSQSIISGNTFNIFSSYDVDFKDLFIFNNNFKKNATCYFNSCDFEKSLFNSTIFEKAAFDDCKFHSTTWFERCKNLGNSKLKFLSCEFKKYVLFDGSKFNKFEILHSKFLEKASFENLETDHFKIHQVTFAGATYFDDLNKNKNSVIENWDKKTLRAIKRELVNTHNQIDYLRVKGYELNAYKKEKGKNWKDNFILLLNQKSNYFGLDWTKGLAFTTITGFMFYLLYLCTYAIVMKNRLHFPNSIEDFFVGYLKFLNPFSLFKSPIEDAETYFFPLFSFMIGKIFISYGIFQTVQAFRKFGVNGG